MGDIKRNYEEAYEHELSCGVTPLMMKTYVDRGRIEENVRSKIEGEEVSRAVAALVRLNLPVPSRNLQDYRSSTESGLRGMMWLNKPNLLGALEKDWVLRENCEKLFKATERLLLWAMPEWIGSEENPTVAIKGQEEHLGKMMCPACLHSREIGEKLSKLCRYPGQHVGDECLCYTEMMNSKIVPMCDHICGKRNSCAWHGMVWHYLVAAGILLVENGGFLERHELRRSKLVETVMFRASWKEGIAPTTLIK